MVSDDTDHACLTAVALAEWPRSVSWMTRLGTALACGAPAPSYFKFGRPARNFVFLIAVYVHIFRRALPPY